MTNELVIWIQSLKVFQSKISLYAGIQPIKSVMWPFLACLIGLFWHRIKIYAGIFKRSGQYIFVGSSAAGPGPLCVVTVVKGFHTKDVQLIRILYNGVTFSFSNAHPVSKVKGYQMRLNLVPVPNDINVFCRNFWQSGIPIIRNFDTWWPA